MNLHASIASPAPEPARGHGRVAPIPHAARHAGRLDNYTTTVQAMRFALWAGQLHAAPTIEQIRHRFDCSRATAYRWRAVYLAVIGSLGE